MATITCSNITKSYGGHPVIEDLNLAIPDHEFVVFLGPSGCGKSTMLRMIAGLEDVSSGTVAIGGEDVTHRHPGQRGVAMVFQSYALYPHMSVRENITFGLRRAGVDKAEIERRLQQVVSILGLEPLLERKPKAMSGGQQQRVAMARAMIKTPKVFLFDEPLSNLDAQLRGQVRAEINRLHQAIGTTILYVTHDQVEAMTLADRIVVMRGGVIEQVGTPDEVYGSPESVFVAGFIGAPAMNFLDARIEGGALRFDHGGALPLGGALAAGGHDGREVIVGLRPEHLVAANAGAGLAGRVQVVEPLGSDTLVHLDIGDRTLTARLPPEVRPVPGAAFSVGIDPGRVRLFDRVTRRAIA